MKKPRIGRSKSSKSIVFTSDMHVMSHKAVRPLKSITGTKANPLQKKLNAAWEYCLDQRHQKTHLLFLNGEPIDGQNIKDRGVANYTTDWMTGLKDASTLLKQYNASNFMMTSGSGYHVDLAGIPAEEVLARDMGAKPYRAYTKFDEGTQEFTDGKRVDHFVWLDVNNVLFSITHHIGFNRWFSYKTTALAREMAELSLARDKWVPKEYINNRLVIVRSHVHYFVGVHYPATTGFITPAWKMPDGFLLRGGLGGTMPHIGTVEVIIEPNEEIHIHPHIIPTKMYPKANVIKV